MVPASTLSVLLLTVVMVVMPGPGLSCVRVGGTRAMVLPVVVAVALGLLHLLPYSVPALHRLNKCGRFLGRA